MPQKIFQTLQKIPPSVRCVWGALFVALLVHLLLLVLFRHTPVQSTYDDGELPKVGRIVLSDKSNAVFAQWMQNHDPSVMTVPNTVLGYSAVAESKILRAEPEDLPNLLQPVIPQKKSGMLQVGQLNVGKANLLLPYSIAVSGNDNAGNNAVLPTVVLNGEYSAAAGEVLAMVLAEMPQTKTFDYRKLPETVLEIMPGRLAGAAPRAVLKKSCGSSELDLKAMEALHKYMLKSSADAGYSGKVHFIWRNAGLPDNR